MPAVQGFVNFDPDKNLPSFKGKIIFITGGTAGLGRYTIERLAKHEPEHIYFTGRNSQAGTSLIADVKKSNPAVSLTFVELDMASLASVKTNVNKAFVHDRLDILMCNAGVMAIPPALSKDGFEIQFAVNHLAHAMVIQQLLPVLRKTADLPGADVRIVCLTTAYPAGPGGTGGSIAFAKLRTTMDAFMGSWLRYGQSKMANLAYAAELAKRYPEILTVSVHPGIVKTDLVNKLPPARKGFVYVSNWVMGNSAMDPRQGSFSQLWTTGAPRGEMINGAFYWPIGVVKHDVLRTGYASPVLREELWKWTEDVLAEY